jgi:hypothetical protein
MLVAALILLAPVTAATPGACDPSIIVTGRTIVTANSILQMRASNIST